MYKQEFKKIVERAVYDSEIIRENRIANPFYIGFGNPNSEIIIFGKEQAFKECDKEQLYLESSNNPNEWLEFIKANYLMQKHEIMHIDGKYINCFYPYSFKMKTGHTWSKYQKLINSVSGKDNLHFNEFLFDSFISEVNFKPSKISELKIYENLSRLEFLKNDFYQNFNVKIFACGNYINENYIKSWFANDETFQTKYFSEKRMKFNVYQSDKQLIIHTRQLSMNVSNIYLEKIASKIIEFKSKKLKSTTCNGNS